jgi:CheY-like chemotaxis protein
MTLPLAVPADPSQVEPPWNTSVKSVLVVQDNEAAAKAVRSLFEFAGARTWSARTGHRALECVAIDNFDVILIDELLPDMAGIELLDRLRSGQSTGNIPIVLMTSTKPAAAGLKAIEHSSEPDATFGKPLRRARLREAVDRAMGGASGPASRAGAGSRPKLGLHVLLVEDSPVNLEVALGMLEAIGCRVDTASDGALGVEQALSWSFDVVLMDCQMPLMDGFEATRRIRAAEATAGRKPMPIIALTANALQGDRERCLAAGMTDFISKPFTMAKLHSSLTAAVPGRARGAAAAAAPQAPLNEPLPTDSAPQLPLNEALRADPAGELPVVDPAQLEELRSLGRPQVLVQATGLFKKQAVQKLDELEAALQRGDATGVEQAAHALKSSALSIGGRRFAAAASDCELAARRSDLAAAGRFPGNLRTEYSRLCDALTEAVRAEERAA